jgi:hypothetical protein
MAQPVALPGGMPPGGEPVRPCYRSFRGNPVCRGSALETCLVDRCGHTVGLSDDIRDHS